MLDKTFDPKAIEEKHYSKWESADAFACAPDGGKEGDKKPWTIMMPPPNVTGSLHMGHALNTTLQDILTRYNRMNGRDALWQPGLDHAGIATQAVVEKQLDAEGTSRHDMGREGFVNRVWNWKAESGGTIIGQMKRLGATPDWSRERFTMDEGLSRAVTKVFVQLHKEGLIYKDKRLVNWDPKLGTTISDIEVEQKEQKGQMWHIRYPIEGATAEYITIATTRPETMLGDTAIAVHPDDERYKDMIGKTVNVPIVNRLIPIIADEYADPEQGSGAVKITPAHDFNDFEVGKRHDLPMINVLDTKAKIAALEDIPTEYHGLDRYEARKRLVKELDEMDLLAQVETIKNSIPYGSRSDVVIEPYLTDQWYVDAETLAKPAIEAVESGKAKFVPDNWKNTYFEWMRNIQPWCISRQLWWGHQIPAWYDEDGAVYVAESEEEARAQAGPDVQLTRDPDVLDTWFSSALWPFSTLGWPDESAKDMVDRYYPGDVLITGFDIIFFWVARMMMMGLHFMDDVPFHTVYMHALVRDSSGQKMSKSKGNVMDPLTLIDKYGADAVRFTLTAMAAQGRDLRLAEERIEGYRNFATKLWNASRYCEMNECFAAADFDPASVTYTPNQWIIGEVMVAKTAIDDALAAYKFNEAANAIYQFTRGTFCDWYLEFTKPLLQEDSDHKAEIRSTTGWVLDQILILLNPFMPFITEELYEARAQEEKEGAERPLLLQTAWPNYDHLGVDEGATEKMTWLIRIISEIRSVRADMNVPAGAKVQLLVKDACDQTQEGFEAYDEILKRMGRLESIAMTGDVPAGSIQVIVDKTTLIMPVADIIDLDKERTRLAKEIDRLDAEIKKVDQNLANKKFVANAPEEVVEEQHSRKAEFLGTKEKLASALNQL